MWSPFSLWDTALSGTCAVDVAEDTELWRVSAGQGLVQPERDTLHSQLSARGPARAMPHPGTPEAPAGAGIRVFGD